MFSDLSFLKYFRSALVSLIMFLCTFSSVWSQEKVASRDDFFREDQFYLGVSFMVLQSSQDNFNPQGLSRHLQWGFVRDIPLNASGKIAAGLGLGMSFERYNTNFNRAFKRIDKVQYTIAEKTASPIFFSVHSLELPLSLRWRNATPDNFAFWRVYGGVSLRWNYYNKISQETFEVKNSSDIQNFGAVANLSFGYNTWNFYLAYHLSPFFVETVLDSIGQPLDLNPIKIGLIFYIL
jgi:hypothetical protein